MSDDVPEFDGPTERLFFEQLVWMFLPEFRAAADECGASNEELEQAAKESESNGALGAVFAFLCCDAIKTRRISALALFLNPEVDVGGVSFEELAAREARAKASA